MSLGPLMIDIESDKLSQEECELLKHPLVGGVILFSRNYNSPAQITELTTAIHKIKQPALLIAVDHEGGRVQRFRNQFTELPACSKLGLYYDVEPQSAIKLAEQLGWLMAAELRAIGVDFSFTPVLDLGKGISQVIGDRAFHKQAEVVAKLAHAMMIGMRQAGMIAVAKHFPGHGSIAPDSHIDIPVDKRRFADLQFEDLIPFERMIHYGLVAIMPAHVIYPQIDDQPAGFSKIWLQDILRKHYEFEGVIFSDDISMAGAAVVGRPLERAQLALQAGCDMVIICNDRPATIEVINGLGEYNVPSSQVRLMRLHGKSSINWAELHQQQKWKQACQICANLETFAQEK